MHDFKVGDIVRVTDKDIPTGGGGKWAGSEGIITDIRPGSVSGKLVALVEFYIAAFLERRIKIKDKYNIHTIYLSRLELIGDVQEEYLGEW